MPIILMADKVLIAHKHREVSRGLDAMALGEMSVEMAIYLQSKQAELNSEDPHEKFAHDQNDVTVVRFWDQPHLKDITNRSYNAGIRGYSPKLLTIYNALTPAGLEKAEKAIPVINTLNDITDGIAYKPELWRDADDYIIMATIPLRTLRMLQILRDGIIRAEQLDAEKSLGTNFGTHDLSKQTTQTNNSKEENNDTEENNLLLDMLVMQTSSASPQLEFEPKVFQVGRFTEAYVPTATFSQVARTDLKHLIKFGLVDLKAHVGAHRGRPKHVVRHSRAGAILLVELEALNIL